VLPGVWLIGEVGLLFELKVLRSNNNFCEISIRH